MKLLQEQIKNNVEINIVENVTRCSDEKFRCWYS